MNSLFKSYQQTDSDNNGRGEEKDAELVDGCCEGRKRLLMRIIIVIIRVAIQDQDVLPDYGSLIFPSVYHVICHGTTELTNLFCAASY